VIRYYGRRDGGPALLPPGAAPYPLLGQPLPGAPGPVHPPQSAPQQTPPHGAPAFPPAPPADRVADPESPWA